MRLLAISDLHLSNAFNRAALAELGTYHDDWLVLAGDVGETAEQLDYALEHLVARFNTVLWLPGNHDLWAIDPRERPLRGEAKYRRLVDVCRGRGVLTPEDSYPVWPGDAGDGVAEGERVVIAPLFLLYDYSFRPPDVAFDAAVRWAEEEGVMCGDEELLDPAPHGTREAWCGHRVELTERRLQQVAAEGHRPVLVNHFPLRADLVELPSIPRFRIWCGTTQTEDWHLRFRALAVVHGHLHCRSSHRRDGVPFEEVSLGYAHQWNRQLGIGAYLRQILPVPTDV